MGGAGPLLDRITVFGATAARGPGLTARFDSLWAIWSVPDYTPAEIAAMAVLRYPTLWRIGPALLADSAAFERWYAALDSVPLQWQAYRARSNAGSHPDAVAALEERALADLASESVTAEAQDYYMLGLVALEREDYGRAVELFGELDRWPTLEPTMLDAAWGLRTLSHLQRGRALEALGDTAAAKQHYATFVDWWNEADEQGRPLVEAAQEGLQRLGD
jgi:tetratricopeptide (TPR) repeat protein